MDGTAIGLRIGLPRQIVENHRPNRLLFIVETTPEAMLRVVDGNEDINRLCRAGRVRLAVLHPESGEVSVFDDDAFHRYQPQEPRLYPIGSSPSSKGRAGKS
jgi:uncharacterized protein